MTDTVNASRREVRKFGITFALLGLAAAALAAWRGNPRWPWLIAAAAAFALGGLVAVPVLRPVYIAWMTFARWLAWVNTRVILGLFFYLVLTPAGLAARALGKDLLDERIDRAAPTYWNKREPVQPDRARYERLF